MSPKNALPVQYPSAMTDASICQDLYARNYMYSALIELLVQRLELANDLRCDEIDRLEQLEDTLRSEIGDLEKESADKEERIGELCRENDGMQTRIDDLEAELVRRNVADGAF